MREIEESMYCSEVGSSTKRNITWYHQTGNVMDVGRLESGNRWESESTPGIRRSSKKVFKFLEGDVNIMACMEPATL